MAGELTGRSVLVVGLGRFGGGVGVTRWLVEQGAKVTVTDLAMAEDLKESVAALSGLPVHWRLGGHDEGHLNGVDLAVINPAVTKNRSAFFAIIAARGVSWTTELNLFCERCPAKIIGVTGSFGKSTTSAMLAETLTHARTRLGPTVGYDQVFLGGNIGRSLLGDLPHIRRDDCVVLEVSNAQLEDTPRIGWTPDIAVITNIQPQHLDRHGSFEAYARTKFNILRGTAGGAGQPCIIGPLTPPADAWLAESAPRNWFRPEAVLGRVPRLRVPGEHNRANAASVLAVADVMRIPGNVAEEGVSAFRGLPHRLEFLGSWGRAKVYNDSKSTAPMASLRALRAIEGHVLLILGGRRKEVDWGELVMEAVRQCRHVVCVGESGPEIAGQLRGASREVDASVAIHEVEDVAAAVRRARGVSDEVDAVLFSPGAQSFDAYRNYVERGLHFTALVKEAGLEPPGSLAILAAAG